MKRTLVLLLCLLMLVATVFVGCKSTDGEATSEPKNTEQKIAKTDSPKEAQKEDHADGMITNGKFPLTEEMYVLNVMAPSQSNIEDITTNTFTSYYEELTNVKVEWEIIPAESAEEKINISLTSGQYPDIYLACSFSASQQMIYGDQGVLIPMDEYIEQSVYFQKAFDAIDNFRELCTLPNGHIYSMPHYNDNPHVIVQEKMWINQVWLDNLGLDVPSTTEEYYNTLKAFKEKDANGNGDPDDEIPLATSTNGWNTKITKYLMKPFVYNNTKKYNLFLEDKKVKPAMVDDGYKEGLMYLNKLYDEGLFYAQSFTQTADQLKQLIENDGSNTVGSMPGGVQNGTNIGVENGRWLEYIAMPPLEGPTGMKQASTYPFVAFSTGSFVITSACDGPDIAFMWGNELYGTDPGTGYAMNQTAQYGIEGGGWVKAEEGMKDFTGEQAFYVFAADGIGWGDMQNYCWRGYVPNIYAPTSNFTELKLRYALEGTAETNNEIRLYEMSEKNYFPYARDAADCFPPLVFSEEDAAIIGDKGTIIDTYVDEMTARFITGDADIAAEWDAYVAEVWNKGLQELIDAHQKAYDASSFAKK